MIKNYLKIALRHLFNHKLYSAINVLGLSIGLTSFLLILLFIRHELSFDHFHPAVDRLYRLSMNFDNGDRYWASNHFYLAPTLRENFPEIEQSGRIMAGTVPVRRDDIAFNETGFRLADPEIFDLFSFSWIQGDPARALSMPFTLVLTQSAAQKYFGDEDPMGQSLFVNNQAPLTVTGVIADLPDNTHLSGDFFTSMGTGVAAFGEQALAGSFDFHTYVRLREGVEMDSLVPALGDLNREVVGRFGAAVDVRVENITDIHFNTLRNELPGTPGSLNVVYTFSAIAAGILLIACINFMNLSTAHSSRRATEVGMRKSIGAGRPELIRQFLGESLVLSFIAMVIAIVLVELLLPAFRNFVGKDIRISILSEPLWLLYLAGLSIIIGVVAGSYPALYLTRFEPSRVLKGDVSRGRAGLLFRNLLVVVQFSISIGLIIATAVIYSQMYFARNVELGYNKDLVVILNGSVTQDLGSQWESMKQELLNHPQITQVTASKIPPATDNFFGQNIWHEGAPEGGTSINFLAVDFDFFETYDIAVVSGRMFDENLATDRMRFPFNGQEPSVAWMLNESAVRLLGWTAADAVGRPVSWGAQNGLTGPVIGVVEDVYFESVRSPQKPLLYMVTGSFFNGNAGPLSLSTASIRVSGNDLPDTLAHIDRTWEAFMPGMPVDRQFLDANFNLMYQAEEKQGQLLQYFSILAVFIACLGLYGLAAFNAERRTKEIGVRKVMGGSIWSIVVLLTNDFSKLVLISNVIAWPVAWYAMNQWLANFAYRIDLTPLIFIGSGLIALCIAWVTVGGTAAKAANRKPVLALRYE